MKRLKSILRWVVGLLLGTYLTVILLLSLPFFQHWVAGLVADALSKHVGSRVEVGRVQLGLTGRLIVDDIRIWDLQGEEMLSVARTGAKIDLLPLLREGDIHINNALLFSAHAHLYQEQPDSAHNFQFLIDAFKSADEEQKPMPHISISSILVRHTSVHYDQRWRPETPGRFNPAHLGISELNLSAQLHQLCQDSLSLSLRKMSLTEQSGLQINNLQAEVEKEDDIIRILDFQCTTPHSHLALGDTRIDLQQKKAEGSLEGHVTPRDFKALYLPLADIHTDIDTRLSYELDTLSARLSDLTLTTSDHALDIDIPFVNANYLKDSLTYVSVKAKHIATSPDVLHLITPFVKELPSTAERLVTTLGETSLQGEAQWQGETGTFDLDLTTALGQLSAEGSASRKKVSAQLSTDGFKVGNILTALQDRKAADSIPLIGTVALTAEADLTLPQNPAKGAPIWNKLPNGHLKAAIHEAAINRYTYHNVNVDLLRQGELCDVRLAAKDPALTLDFQGKAHLSAAGHALQGLLDVEHFRPQDLHLMKKGLVDVRTKVGIDVAGSEWHNITGDLSIPHIIVTDEEGTVTLSSLQVESSLKEGLRHVSLTSPYIKGKADGHFEWNDLAQYLQQTVHQWIPGIVKAPSATPSTCQADFSLTVTDPTPLERFAGIPLRLKDGPLQLNALVDTEQDLLNVYADAPSIGYGSEDLLHFCFSTQSQHQKMATRLSASRIMKNNPVDIALHIDAEDQLLTTRLSWDDHLDPVTSGAIALRGNVLREDNQVAIEGEVLPTSLQIGDTLWNIQPTRIHFHDGVLGVQDFRMTMEDDDRWLAVHGNASKSPEDTLLVDLKGIELGYIFDLVHVKPLSLRGLVTGHLYGTHLFAQPEAHGHVVVPHILFNEGDMGTLDAQLAWGATPGNLEIDARIEDKANQAWLDANGYLHLIKDPTQSLDLKFNCHRANLHFMNRYVAGIMQDVEGRATGKVNVYGTFGDVDLSGDADIEEAALTIPSLNTRYHVLNEHVSLRPDGLELKNITGYDPQGGPGIPDHFATVNGRISYSHFRDMRFNFNVTGQNVLAYNFPEPDDLPFWGVVYGTGGVQISGSPGQTNIDIDARPTTGTQLVYKVSTPETLTKSKFITFVDSDDADTDDEDDGDDDDDEDKPEGDMTINFNIDLTPEAEMRLLMDPRAGDYISLYGSSRLRATYYNKGNFRMYGTYRVDHGTYRMSIQDVIRKDFQFRQGGTIVFGGPPFEADLGLQAIYTVPSVSLNDLSARGTFSNNNVRVNCIMNLGGKAGEPRVTFDFDIPNVNDDELRMVRSLISTEEERNLQVIYLLGIGRFYTYDYTGIQAQSSTAMNSLLSSTLSGQLNQVFSNLMGGNQNWNIGANLSTGDMGWSDMDVEGMLSGRLLNNRLLINGNFGYRDNPVAASNFIGDFDLQWILNKQGNLILKAYSETNDRYFTKSALTTQGVGILLKKDFIRWTDLFKRKKK